MSFWRKCLRHAMHMLVPACTTSSAATRPVDVAAPASALLCPTMHTSATSIMSSSTSEHMSLSAVRCSYLHICIYLSIAWVCLGGHLWMCVCVGMVCLGGMMYHPCTSACGKTCQSISISEVCDGDCAEGCSCTEGTYYDHARQRCVLLYVWIPQTPTTPASPCNFWILAYKRA